MRNQEPDHSVFQEWLHAELEGELTAGERSKLRQHLTRCSDCRKEREELERLLALLAESRLPARAELRDEVMAALPAAGWESRSPKSWIAASIAALLLMAGSAALIGLGDQTLQSGMPLMGAALAIAELLRSSAVAGAGLIGASWKGLGMAFQEVLGGSTLNLVALCAVVLGLDILLVRYLLRRGRSPAAAQARGGDGEARSGRRA